MEIKEEELEKELKEISGGKVIRGKDGKFYVTTPNGSKTIIDEFGDFNKVYATGFSNEKAAKIVDIMKGFIDPSITIFS